MSDVGSSVPRRQLGRYLRKLREDAGFDIEGAARNLEWSRARQYRIERGETTLRTHEVEAMCRAFGAPDEMLEVLVGLTRETKSRGWWQAYGEAVPEWFELYVGLEAAASELRTFEPMVLPGLLQTEEYAQVLSGEQGVKIRMERQKVIGRRHPKPPRLDFIVDESVLRRPLSSSEAWVRQLEHLLGVVRPPSLTVRVLPLSVGPHYVTLAGAFVLLDFPNVGPNGAEPTTVYSESLTGALYLDKAKEVDAYRELWDGLSAAALDTEGTRHLIWTILKEID